jgi:hypothetical protein
MLDRERVGREASPTGGVIDSQSVKAPEAKTRGYDAGKKIVGRSPSTPRQRQLHGLAVRHWSAKGLIHDQSSLSCGYLDRSS